MPSLANRLAYWLLSGLLALLVACLPVLAQQTGVCKNDGGFYTQQGYTVKKIIIETPLSGHLPLGFLFGLESRLQTYLAATKLELPLKEGQPFSNNDYAQTAFRLAQLFGSLRPGERFRVAYPVAELRGCDDNARTLDVSYRVYTSDYLSFLSRAFEAQPEKISRALLPQALTTTSKFLPAPFVGYNRSRGIFGGARLSINTPLGPLKRADVEVSGSSSSATVQLGLIGDHKFKAGVMDHVEGRLGYRYFDLPADTIRHKGGALLAQAFASTKPLSWHNLVLRFGSSLEGGHLQTDLSEPAAIATNLLRTSYGALKMYVGGTTKFGRQSLKASYGLQLGQAGKEVKVDYVKQVFDAAYSVRFLPRDHLPLQLDTQFSAGVINSSSGRIPLAERFYGGNTRRNFLQGDDWQINSDVFLRSFPQNRLNRIGLLGPLGGKNFFSLNLTASQTIWNRTLVPKELLHDPALYTDLKIQLRGALETQRGALELSLLSETDGFRDLALEVEKLGEKLGAIKAALNTPKMLALTGDVSDLRSEADSLTDDALAPIAEFRKSKNKDLDPIITLVRDFDSETPAAAGACVVAVEELLLQLTTPELEAQKNHLRQLATDLRTSKMRAGEQYQAIRNLLVIKPEDLKDAQQPVAEVTQRLNNIEGELNRLALEINPETSDDRRKELRLRIKLAQGFVTEALNDAKLSTNSDTTNAVKGLSLLAEGFEVAVARLTGVIKSINDLKPLLAGLDQSQKTLTEESNKLAKLQQEIKRAYMKIPRTRPQLQSAEAVDYTGHVFDVIFREMNLVAISPVVMLDVARLGPQTSPIYRGLRYGIGGGVKFSLVTFNITAAYSWNANRRPGEGRGAFVFSMDISDLFR